MAELAANGHDLRRADRSVYWWIVRGWLDDSAEVRGEDDIIPSAEGRLTRPRLGDSRRLEIRGQIAGATDAEFLTLVQELAPMLFDRSADPWPLVAADGYRGLASGKTATINVRTVNITPDPGLLSYRRIYAVELESVDSPPEWVLSS